MELIITSDHLTLDGRDFAWDADDALGDLPARATDLRAACSAITDYEAARDRWDEAALATFGADLFTALFPPDSDRRAAFEDTAGPLIITAQGELADLPWELLRDETGWLAQERGVLRRVGEIVADPPPPAASSLDVLVAVASPLLAPDPDLRPDHPAQPGILEVEGEWQALRDALGELDRAVHARLLPHATLPALDDALGDPTAVLHLNAHGGVGRVLLEDGMGRGVEVAADRLRAPVRRAGLRLAVLRSCLTGAELLPFDLAQGRSPQQPGDDPQRVLSVARVLLEAGVPLTLAMQAPTFVEAGRRFTAAFYRDLARGRSVNEAVALARRRLSAEAGQPSVAPWSWATPALYIAAPAEWATAPLTQGSRGEFEPDDPRPRPLGFPQPTGRFVGRRAEQVAILENLDWAHDSRPRVLGLLGSGGVGKTALALAVTPRLLPRLGRGGRAVWAAARPTLPPGELPEHVAAAVAHHLAADEREFLADLARGLGLGREEAGRLEAEGLVEWIVDDLSRGPRTLLVLDNMESLFERRNGTYWLAPATAGLLRDLPRQVRALCTSRHALGVNEERLTLAPLLPLDAGTLARWYAARWRVDLSSRALQNLVQGTGGHPLAMRLVIARIADLEERDVRGALARLLTERERAPDDEAFFRYLYDESLARAGADGEALFAALALFATHARRDALAAALEWGDERVGGAMGRLRDLSLALEGQAWDGEDVLVLEPPARAQAARLLAKRPEAEIWASRVAQFFRDYARQFGTAMDTVEATRQARKLADEQLDGWMLPRLPKEMHSQYAGLSRIEKENLAVSLTVAQARAALETERANVGAAIQWSAEAGEHNLLMDLMDAINAFLGIAGYWREKEHYQRLALAAAREVGNERAVAVCAHNLAMTLDGLGEKAEAEALYAEAERVLAAPEHQREMAAVLHQQGILAQSRGDYDAALGHYRRSLEMLEQLGDRAGVAKSLNAIGLVLQERGDYDKALDYYQRSLQEAEAIGDRQQIATVLHAIGIVHRHLGDYDVALEHHRRSLEMLEQLGDRAGVAKSLNAIGLVLQERGDYDKALDYYQRSLQEAEAIGDRQQIATVLHAIGMVHQLRGDYPAALEHYRCSLEIKKQLGDRAGVATSVHQIGMVYQDRGDYQAALEHYRRSLEMREQLGDRAGVAYSLGQIGNVHYLRGEWDNALQVYQQAWAVSEEMGDRPSVAKALHQIGQVLEMMEQWEDASSYYGQSLSINLEIGIVVGAILTHRAIGLLSIQLGTYDDIAPHFAQALLFSLQVTPRLALETVGRMQHAAERLLATGQAEVVGGMAAAGLQVVEPLLEELQGEKQQIAALCRAILQVIGLAAVGEREQALEQAQEVDDATEGMFGLMEWVGQLLRE